MRHGNQFAGRARTRQKPQRSLADAGLTGDQIATEASRCFNCGCLAVNPSDIAVALVALDATIVNSARTISAESFFRADAAKSTILDTDEIITGIMIPGPSGHFRQNYTKFTPGEMTFSANSTGISYSGD